MRRVFSITLEDTVAPFVDRTALFQFLAFPIGLWLVDRFLGDDELFNQLSTWLAFVVAMLWAVPIFLAVNFAQALVKARLREGREGKWHGDEFIFSNPVLVHSQRIFAADHGKTFEFVVDAAPAKSHVRFEVELQPKNQYWTAVVGPAWSITEETRMLRVGPELGATIGDRRQTKLAVWSSRADVSSTIARVWMHSWNCGDVPL